MAKLTKQDITRKIQEMLADDIQDEKPKIVNLMEMISQRPLTGLPPPAKQVQTPSNETMAEQALDQKYPMLR
jgi:hypothetical protein